MSELRFYNTLTRQVEAFRPLEPGKVRMYHCGPTVYQRPHIGNYRAFLFADLLRRVFEARGLEVQQVMNLTDVGHLVDDADDGEDKLEAQARKDRVDPWELTRRVSAQFFADLDALGVLPAHAYPKATDHIDDMVAMVRVLIEKGHAYRVGDNVYFSVQSFAGYGRLSGNRIDDLEAGARVEVNLEKRHPADFALWKSDARHIMKWATEFGSDGFPGWHIECSAMSRRHLGDRFDLHTGGEDNVFPHHECEIAQSEAFLGGPWVALWMHTKFLQVDGGKMSKSLGNVYSLDDLREQGFDALDFRFFVMRAHYRGSINFTWEALRGAAESRKSLHDFMGRLRAGLGAEAAAEPPPPGSRAAAARHAFDAALADDLNASEAVAALFQLRNAFLKDELAAAELPAVLGVLEHADAVLGLGIGPPAVPDGPDDAAIDALLQERAAAREAKDFARSDAIRDRLAAAGVVIEDGVGGTRWHRS